MWERGPIARGVSLSPVKHDSNVNFVHKFYATMYNKQLLNFYF